MYSNSPCFKWFLRIRPAAQRVLQGLEALKISLNIGRHQRNQIIIFIRLTVPFTSIWSTDMKMKTDSGHCGAHLVISNVPGLFPSPRLAALYSFRRSKPPAIGLHQVVPDGKNPGEIGYCPQVLILT